MREALSLRWWVCCSSLRASAVGAVPPYPWLTAGMSLHATLPLVLQSTPLKTCSFPPGSSGSEGESPIGKWNKQWQWHVSSPQIEDKPDMAYRLNQIWNHLLDIHMHIGVHNIQLLNRLAFIRPGRPMSISIIRPCSPGGTTRQTHPRQIPTLWWHLAISYYTIVRFTQHKIMGISENYLLAFSAHNFASFWFVVRRWFERVSVGFYHSFLITLHTTLQMVSVCW